MLPTVLGQQTGQAAQVAAGHLAHAGSVLPRSNNPMRRHRSISATDSLVRRAPNWDGASFRARSSAGLDPARPENLRNLSGNFRTLPGSSWTRPGSSPSLIRRRLHPNSGHSDAFLVQEGGRPAVLGHRRRKKVEARILGETDALKHRRRACRAFPLGAECNADSGRCLLVRWLLDLVLRELRPGELVLQPKGGLALSRRRGRELRPGELAL